MADDEVKRDKRVTVSLTGDAYENVKEVARKSGLSPAAWMAMVVTQQSTQVIGMETALLDAAREQIRSTFGTQECIDVIAHVMSEDGENAT